MPRTFFTGLFPSLGHNPLPALSTLNLYLTRNIRRLCQLGYLYLHFIIELHSLSKVVGTHAVLDCKSISIICYAQYRSPPPSPINVAFSIYIPKRIKSDRKWHTTLNRGRGEGEMTLVEIKDFCYLSQYI